MGKLTATKYAGAIALVLALGATPTALGRTPDTWDDLLKVESKNFDAAYLLPGADFRGYTKVMIDPTEAAFQKNWQRDYNSNARGGDRISDEEALTILAQVQEGFRDIFVKAYTDAGYEVVAVPGPDVVRLRTAILNLDIVAPDQQSAGRSRTYSNEAGHATLVVEVRDSMSGAILARAVDKRDIGDSAFMVRRSSVSNRSDFERTFSTWAKMSVEGLGVLRSMPPLEAETAPPQ
jgi:hypothetical protein